MQEDNAKLKHENEDLQAENKKLKERNESLQAENASLPTKVSLTIIIVT